MNKTLMIAAAAAACLAGTAHAQLDLRGKMKEGKYSTTFKMEIPGLPAGFGGVNHSVETCTTKEDIEKGKSDVFRDPKSGKKESSCEIKNVKADGNTMSYDMECPKEGMSASTVITFGGDTVKGVTKTRMTGDNAKNLPPGMQNMTSTFESKYLGACSK